MGLIEHRKLDFPTLLQDPDSLANVGILVTFEQVRMLKFVDAEPA